MARWPSMAGTEGEREREREGRFIIGPTLFSCDPGSTAARVLGILSRRLAGPTVLAAIPHKVSVTETAHMGVSSVPQPTLGVVEVRDMWMALVSTVETT